jgi:integrase
MSMGTLSITDSLHARVLDWLDRPRTRISVNARTIKNRKADLGTFQHILERYTAEGLEDESTYVAFLSDLEHLLSTTTLKESTLGNKLTFLTTHALVQGGMSPALVAETKQHIRAMRKRIQRTVPATVSQPIGDDDLLRLIRSLDDLVESHPEVPNLCAIANPGGQLSGPEHSSMRDLLAVRAYVWLAVTTAGRADEIRRLHPEDVSPDIVVRHITKQRYTPEEKRTTMFESAWSRIAPWVQHVEAHHPEARHLFSETEDITGTGCFNPGRLRLLVKGAMMHAGMPPTCEGGYHRTHDLRKVWSRWIDAADGDLEEVCAFLGHKDPRTTYAHYFAKEHKTAIGDRGHERGLEHLKSLLQERDEMDLKIARLKELLGHLEEVYVGDDGAVVFPSPDASDEDSVMWDPWLNGSGLVVPTPGLEPGTP